VKTLILGTPVRADLFQFLHMLSLPGFHARLLWGSVAADLGSTWSAPGGFREGNPLLGQNKFRPGRGDDFHDCAYRLVHDAHGAFVAYEILQVGAMDRDRDPFCGGDGTGTWSSHTTPIVIR
jgi:hypothetical protein